MRVFVTLAFAAMVAILPATLSAKKITIKCRTAAQCCRLAGGDWTGKYCI